MVSIERVFGTLALLVAGGCATSANTDQLRARAAFDLQCDQAQLQVVDIDDRTKGVTGCGHQATYVKTELPPTWTEPAKETWVKNSETTGQATKP